MADDPKMYLDHEGFEHPEAPPSKYIHAGDHFQDQPHLYLDEQGASLVAGRKNVLAVDDTFGILLGGPVSISTMPDQISFAGGYYRLNPLTLSTVPSTTPTPIPALVKATPNVAQVPIPRWIWSEKPSGSRRGLVPSWKLTAGFQRDQSAQDRSWRGLEPESEVAHGSSDSKPRSPGSWRDRP